MNALYTCGAVLCCLMMCDVNVSHTHTHNIRTFTVGISFTVGVMCASVSLLLCAVLLLLLCVVVVASSARMVYGSVVAEELLLLMLLLCSVLGRCVYMYVCVCVCGHQQECCLYFIFSAVRLCFGYHCVSRWRRTAQRHTQGTHKAHIRTMMDDTSVSAE